MILSFYNNYINSPYKQTKNTYQFTGARIKMQEDFFAKSRNGHLLKNTYNKEANTLDIYSTGLYPANVLSNLAHKEFTFDGVACSSIEGFLQSLKTKDTDKQVEICKLYGGSAKNISKKLTQWLETQKLYWMGKEYLRESKEFFQLLFRAFKSCYEQNKTFKNALDSTRGITLTHNEGKSEKHLTILTKEEFIKILTDIRDNI